MNDDDLRATFKQEERANAPAFSTVLNRATTRHRPRFTAVILALLSIAIAVPLGWFSSGQRPANPSGVAEILVPTTDWLLVVAEPDSAPQASSH
jgi:hypothetical protein